MVEIGYHGADNVCQSLLLEANAIDHLHDHSDEGHLSMKGHKERIL